MNARVCRCCGGAIGTEAQRPGTHVCADCERLLEDDSPSRALLEMAELGGPGQEALQSQGRASSEIRDPELQGSSTVWVS